MPRKRSVGIEEFRPVAAFPVVAVIGGKDHQGVFIDAPLLELGQEGADIPVHARDHRRLAFVRFRPVFRLVDAVVRNLLSITRAASALVVLRAE